MRRNAESHTLGLLIKRRGGLWTWSVHFIWFRRWAAHELLCPLQRKTNDFFWVSRFEHLQLYNFIPTNLYCKVMRSTHSSQGLHFSIVHLFVFFWTISVFISFVSLHCALVYSLCWVPVSNDIPLTINIIKETARVILVSCFYGTAYWVGLCR